MKGISAVSANMVMDLAMFSTLRDQHSPGTLPVSHSETKSATDQAYVPVQSLVPTIPVLV